MATDKIEVEKLSVIKGREGRDLDTLVDGDTLISGETSAGVFGVFKFFEGIKAFFKGVTALGTLAKTNKIPVLQDDGSLKFTTPADITSGLASTSDVNNALANYDSIVQKDTFAECVSDYKNKTFIVLNDKDTANRPSSIVKHWFIETKKSTVGSYTYVEQVATSFAGDTSVANVEYRRIGYINSDTYTWGNWEKVVTESKFKTKQITDTTSANGNLNFSLSGFNTVVVSVQSYNDEGFDNDTIIIPYKLGDNKPIEGSVGPTSTGRWGGHCVTSNGAMTVKANTLIHCTVHYYEI